ncbi:TIP41-like family-domain-containing protein [Nemania serpens]|nr:TIP41-like family-domain-containing protein [Nemania serpens]
MATPPTGHRPPFNALASLTEPRPSPAHLAAATRTHRQGPFEIASRKLPISKAGPIEALEKDLGIPVPEMIFGDNLVSVTHLPTGWRVEFGARDALDAVGKTGDNMLRVSYAGEWSASRERTSAGIRDVVRPFDWSYSTAYKGTVVAPPPETVEDGASEAEADATTETETDKNGAANAEDTAEKTHDSSSSSSSRGKRKRTRRIPTFAPTDEPIPLELLKRRDPIRFFDDVMLYESELDDNGISVLSAKLRVHDERMLLLCRLYMRLDDVVCRVRDTRIYVDFAAEVVTREYTAREASFHDVRQVSRVFFIFIFLFVAFAPRRVGS